jgi:hypothetical protein
VPTQRETQLERDLRRVLGRVEGLERDLAAATTRLDAQSATLETLRRENVVLRRENTELREELAESREQTRQATIRAERAETELGLLRAATAGVVPGPSTPPSKRPYPKRTPAGSNAGKRSGGQQGHPGAYAGRREPDLVVVHEPTGACGCGRSRSTGDLVGSATRQEIGIEAVVKATDHVVSTRRCACGEVSVGEFPAGVSAPVCYDQSVRAFAVGLGAAGLLPSRTVAGVMAGLCGLPVAASSITAWTAELAGALDPFADAARAALAAGPWLGADETTMRCASAPGKSWYVHVAVNDKVTLFHLGAAPDSEGASLSGRSSDDIRAGKLVGSYDGVLVTDAYGPYFSLHSGAHQLCLAHLIREARWWAENHMSPSAGAAVPDFEGLADLLALCVHDRVDRLGEVVAAAALALAAMAEDRRAQADKPRAYLTRLITHSPKLMVFTGTSAPPTNNAAERAIRPCKVKQNRSMTFRSFAGMADHLAIASYLGTAAKNGVDPLAAIKDALAGQPFLPQVLVTT